MKEIFTVENFRKNFPILDKAERKLIYLDNAATMQVPESVLTAMNNHYLMEHANIHRGVYYLSELSSKRYENARKIVGEFINAESDEVILTSGTTAAINLAAYILFFQGLVAGDEVVITSMEHHSNYLIWNKLCQMKNVILRIVSIDSDGCLDMETFYKCINERTKIVSFTQMSNVTGIVNPVNHMIDYVRKHSSAKVIVDGAQGIVHLTTDVKQMDCDMYCFSGHKLGGPTGIGVLYMKKELIDIFEPAFPGGGNVLEVTSKKISYFNDYRKFESGTPNIAGAIGLGEAIRFWQRWDRRSILENEKLGIEFLEDGLEQINKVYQIGKRGESKGAISFRLDGMHAMDVAKILDAYNIAVRSGHHCAQHYLEKMGENYACRISIAPYNTEYELHQFIEILKKISRLV